MPCYLFESHRSPVYPVYTHNFYRDRTPYSPQIMSADQTLGPGSKPKSSDQLLQEYSLNMEYARAEIVRISENSEIIYKVHEPELTSMETVEFFALKTEINDQLPDILGQTAETKFDLEFIIASYVKQRRPWLKGTTYEKILYYLIRDFRGYGLIDPMVRDQKIEDISCDGPGMPIFVYHKEFGSIKTTTSFPNSEALDSYIIRLAQISGKSVSINSPILDSITRDGHRVQAVYGSEVSSRGPVLTLRLFRERPFTPIDLIKSGTASPELMTYLWFMVEGLNSALIVGAPGAGKTSTLNSLLIFAPTNTKVFSIEETRELNIPLENWIAAETRGKNSVAGQKGVDMLETFDLVTMAMRQRPTYIVVGEVRGKETYALFQAMATGHTTYSTIHADSMESLLNRLENEPMNIPRVLVSYLNIVVFINFVRLEGKMVRRITEIDEIIGIDGKTDEILYNRVFKYNPEKDNYVYSGSSKLYDHLMDQRSFNREEFEKEVIARTSLLRELVDAGSTDNERIAKTIRLRQWKWMRGDLN